jgi:hypothetical protein
MRIAFGTKGFLKDRQLACLIFRIVCPLSMWPGFLQPTERNETLLQRVLASSTEAGYVVGAETTYVTHNPRDFKNFQVALPIF